MYRNRQPGVERRPFSLFVTAFPERFLIQGGVLCGNDGVGECLFRVAAAFLRQGPQELSVQDEPLAMGGHLVQVSLRSDQPRLSVQNRFRNSSRPEGNGRGLAGHGFQSYVGKDILKRGVQENVRRAVKPGQPVHICNESGVCAGERVVHIFFLVAEEQEMKVPVPAPV